MIDVAAGVMTMAKSDDQPGPPTAAGAARKRVAEDPDPGEQDSTTGNSSDEAEGEQHGRRRSRRSP